MQWPNGWKVVGIGLVESAKKMDSWSSWSFEGSFIFVFLVKFHPQATLVLPHTWGVSIAFYFFVLFVVYRWWALFCIFHGMGDTRCWPTWSVVLSLDEMCNEGRWMTSIRWSFQLEEAKFLLAKFLSFGSNECLLVYVCLSVGVWKMQFVSGCGEGWMPLLLFEVSGRGLCFFSHVS
jgi:hypothetical protein